MTKSIPRRLLPLPAILLLAASPNYHFPKIDADEDGAISWEEYAKIGSHVFLEADANFDGYLTMEEGAGLQTGLREADMIHFYRQADSNDDGYMDEAEFIQWTRHQTRSVLQSQYGAEAVRLQKNSNNLSEAEQKTLWRTIRKKQEEKQKRNNQIMKDISVAMNLCAPDPGADPNLQRHLSSLVDCDQDGVVTMNENRRIMKIRFTQKDLNADGVLKDDEIPAAALFSF